MRRRTFLLAAGVAAAMGIGAWLATRRPPPDLIASTCTGDPSMERMILVAYATRTGSTAEVAEAIGMRLCAAGMDADVLPVADVPDVEAYAGVVLGSAVRYAAWLPEMHDFLAAHRARLAERPVAFFTMHMLALGDTPEAIAERAKYTAKAREIVQPVEEVFFEGKIDPARLSLFDQLAVRLVKSPVGDRRDWDRINAWAVDLVPRLA